MNGIGPNLSTLGLSYKLTEMRESDGGDPNSSTRAPNVFGNASIAVGQWHQVEYYYKINDIGPTQANGVFKMWRDAGLIISETDIRWRSDQNPTKFFLFQVTPVIGGIGGSRSTDDFMRIDGLYLSVP